MRLPLAHSNSLVRFCGCLDISSHEMEGKAIAFILRIRLFNPYLGNNLPLKANSLWMRFCRVVPPFRGQGLHVWPRVSEAFDMLDCDTSNFLH